MTQRSTTRSLIPEHETSFRLMFERSADAILLLDPRAQLFVECNPAAMALLRATDKNQILMSSPASLSPEIQPDGSASLDKSRAMTEEVLARGTHRFEWMSRRFDGTDLLIEVSLTAIQPGDNPLVAVTCRDISERKRMEADLRVSEARWRRLFEQMPFSIQVFAPDGTTRQVNRAYEKLFLMSLPDLTDFNIRTDPQIAAAGLAPLVARAFKGEVVTMPPIRFELRPNHGEQPRGERWIGATLFPLQGPGGRLLEVVCVHEDVSDRKRAEDDIRRINATLEQRIADRTAELKASEARLRTILEHAPEAIVVFDADTGRFLMANQHALELYGCAAEAVSRLTPAEVSPEFQPDGRRSADAARDWITQAMAGKVPMFEWLHQHSTGRLIPTEVRLVRLPGEGRPLVRASILDITEHKLTEEALRQRGEQIQRHRDVLLKLARQDKSDFELALRKITALAARTMQIARVSYWSLEDNDSALVCELLYHNDSNSVDQTFQGTRLSVKEAPDYFSALALKRPIVAPDVGTHRATAELVEHYLRPLGIASMLDVPVWIRGEVVGVICHEQVGPPREWSAEEIDFASSLAAMVSLALEESQRARSERQLRESEEKFKRLFELSPLGMARVSWDGRFLQVNESFARIIGYTSEQVLELSYWDVTPREYEQQELKILETIRTTGRFGPFEKEYIHRDGHRVPIVINGMLVKSPEGEDQVWGIVDDITARKQAEKALRESELNYRALFESSSQGVMLHDETGFLQVNAAAAKIFGLPPSECVGLHPRDFAAPIQPDGVPSDEAAERRIEDCLRDGQTRFEWLSRRANGDEVPLDVGLTRIEVGGRMIIQAVVTDISARKRAETELKRALEHERELSQLKSNFVSMVSHEFRTPLGIIQSSAEILNDYLEQLGPAERQEQLTSIIRNSRRMAGLMEEVLLLGRFDAGRMQFHPAPLDVAALCRQLVDEVRSTTDQICPIEFFTAELPELLDADERLLRHILLNLLTNAVKYSDPGQSVTFQVHRQSDAVEFQIQDRGIGIPVSEQEQLFEAFRRGSNVGNRHGSGLGLVIVKRCVELHGGDVQLDSREGEGTSVCVRIPVRQDAPSST